MSRHRTIQLSRSRAIAFVAAGAFSIAIAASVTAATWSSGSPRAGGPAPGSAHAAAGLSQLTVTDGLALPQAETDSQQAGVSAAQLARAIRDVFAERAAARLLDARKAAAARAAAAAAPSPAAPQLPAVTTDAAASGSPQQIAEAMLASFGWSPGQFACLDPLWAHESGWSVTAYNAGTGAYGIPQALPGARMASAGPDWQTDAATQIRWGLEYIRDTYGSPCAAWAHEEAVGWY